MPNYEVYDKPWVEHIVSSLAGSPAILGWQLGNELKARNSPRNGISPTESYDWYLAFTRDVVDTIRAADHGHLIFLGAQDIAELTDWEYRPHDHLDPQRVPRYHQLVQKMLDDCGRSCWNVWSVTDYDFNPYPVDDVVTFERAGVPVVATEYGFTRGSPGDAQKRFGGDRVAATRDGLDRPWENLAGDTEPAFWSVPQLFSIGGLAGIAPWGSPAPGPAAAFDTDADRGVTGAPDGPALWTTWANVGQALETENKQAGPSAACLNTRS
ncbi:MAG: hypothetical protein ACRDIY_09560 [Chloroflexota bacterium]